jgi:DNA primase
MSRLLAEAQGIVEHLIDDAAEAAGTGAADRANAVASLAPVLSAVTNAVELELYVERAARRFGLADGSAVRRLLRAHGTQSANQGRASRPAHDSAAGARTPLAPGKDRVKLPQLESELMGALLDRPALFVSDYAEQLRGLLTTPELVDLLSAAQAALQENGELELSALLSALENNAALPWVQERLARPSAIAGYDPEKELQAGLPMLSKQNVERAARALKNQIIEARRAGDDGRALELQRQLIELERSAK